MAAPIAALVALGQSAWQYAQAEQQKKKAKNVKPSNYVPPGVENAIANTRLDANASMGPHTQRGLGKLKQSTATTIENARRIGGTPAQLQQTVMDADAREKEVIKDLEVSDAAWKGQRRMELNSNLLTQGSYQKMSKDASDAAKSALLGASMQNKYNAVSNAAEGIIYSLPDKAFQEGSKGSTSTTPATSPEPAEAYSRGMRQADVSRWSGRYPKASINMRPFDLKKYYEDLRMKRFTTGY